MSTLYYFHSGNAIDDFIGCYCAEWLNGTVLPKLHILEDHATDFVKKVEDRVRYIW